MIVEQPTTISPMEEISSSVITDQQNLHSKRKREFLRQTSRSSVDEEETKSHKRTASRNNTSIFRMSIASQDEEQREDPAADVDEDDDQDCDDEINLVNAYRSTLRQQDNAELSETVRRCASKDRPEPLDLPPLSPRAAEECDFMTFSPVSSFFHPAILRATTICESASDILCGDPPEVDSRPCSPRSCGDEEAEVTMPALQQEKERDVPSWLNGAPRAFNWSISQRSGVISSSQSSPWTGVFQFGSS